jgi:hypothetical protein
VSADDLPRLIVKELVDNALDAGGGVSLDVTDGNGFYVADDGPGIPGTDEDLARLFSIRRPLTSSKLFRLPSRGSLGNGLRVVAGAVLSTRGSLTVATCGRSLRLTPRDDGGTDHVRIESDPLVGTGARIEIRLGAPAVVDSTSLFWGRQAKWAVTDGPKYQGKTSPHWYDPDAFFELCQAAGTMTARELIAQLDGCTEPKAGKITGAFRGVLARDLSRDDAATLLQVAKDNARMVNPARLGYVGRTEMMPSGYSKIVGNATLTSGQGTVKVPICLEVWADIIDDDETLPGFSVYVNRTPVASETFAWHDERNLQYMQGCGFEDHFKVGKRPALIVVNLETPYVPLTTDGKTPDLGQIDMAIKTTVEKAIGSAKRYRKAPDGGKQLLRDMIIDVIPEGAQKAGGGQFRFAQRQLFYAVRDMISRAENTEIKWEYFCSVVTDYENVSGDIPDMTRDPRGTLYHPHTHEEIPLGTLEVERYHRPAWTFNKILYCEKEGLFSMLRAIGWPEINDCALMSSNGYATRAARDVFDALGETDEDITFFCVHDCDAFGTMIYQALQGATKARAARRVKVVNLGLDIDEATAMNLPAEPVERKKNAPVASYVDPKHQDWFQKNRIELNAMTTPQFLAWLNAKVAPYVGKVIPPPVVMTDRLAERLEANLREIITERVLTEARVDDQVARAVAERTDMINTAAATIADVITTELNTAPRESWSVPIERIAGRIAKTENKEAK